jgi:dihydroorotase
VQGACVSAGWFDVGVQAGDPGYEHREDLDSVTEAAAIGGYTSIATQPNTKPAIHSKSEILYIKNKNLYSLVEILPIGALSVDCAGKDIAEFYDMHYAGAVAFSDGAKSVQDAGLMLRALQYARGIEALVINYPNTKSIAPQGQMHEGIVSTSLGLTGLPAMAEELMIQRDLHLVAYSDGRLHFANISTTRAVELVREAKRQGLRVTASVAALNLAFTDETLTTFDANLKVLPPLRTQQDVDALLEGLADNTIDFIASNHVPLDEEVKNLEFSYADFGAIGLQTTFALSNFVLHKKLTISQIIHKIALAPRQVLGFELPKIEVGEKANLTLFNPDEIFVLQEKAILSKSKNSPLVGKLLRGKVLGVINRGQAKIF